MDKDDLRETQRFLKDTAANLHKVAEGLRHSDEVAQAKTQAGEALKSLGVAARLAAKVAGETVRTAAEAARHHDSGAKPPATRPD